MLELRPERLNFDDFNHQQVSICGKSFYADMSGALYWPSSRALIVADLQLASSNPPLQDNLPRSSVDAGNTLQQLASVIDRYSAKTVIVLGNGHVDPETPANGQSDHADAAAAMAENDRATLDIIQDHCKWIWVHEPEDASTQRQIGGQVCRELTMAGLTFRHRPHINTRSHEIAGGLRPAAAISRHGHQIRRPCFVGNGLRMILPAFGTYTGGLNVLSAAFEPLFETNGFKVWLLGHEGIHPVATRLLCED